MTYVVVAFQKVWCKSELSIHMENYMCVFIRESNPKSRTLEPGWPLHDIPVACVITQHFSLATFVSSHFHYHQKKFAKFLKINIFIFFHFFLLFQSCISLKFKNLKLQKSGSVSSELGYFLIYCFQHIRDKRTVAFIQTKLCTSTSYSKAIFFTT
jgi:hypothetical protein